MANQVYDPEAEQENTPASDNSVAGNQTSPDQSSYSTGSPSPGTNSYGQTNNDVMGRGGLRGAEENGGTGSSETGRPDKSISPGGLRSGEESGLGGGSTSSSTGGYASGNGSLYNADGDTRTGLRGKLGQARNKASNLKAKALKKKLLVGGALGGGTAIIALIILIALVIGGYKVVNFAEHVAAYQFARNTAQMAENTAAINEEKVALESIPDNATGNTLYDHLKTKYTGVTGKASDLWSKLDNYRPNKILENFGTEGSTSLNTMQFNEATTRLGRTYVKSVTLNGETAELESKSLGTALRNNVIPGYKFVTRDVAFSRNFAPDLIEALKADSIGPITRARVASQIRQEFNIGLVAWVAGRFAGKSPTDTKVAITQDAYNVAEEGSASTITSSGSTGATTTSTSSSNSTLKEASQQAKAAENAEVNDAAQVKTKILPNTNSLPDSVQTALAGIKESALGLGGLLSDIVGFINPFYKIAVPLCLVYDGSLVKSGPTIDTQSTQSVRSAVWVQSAAGQLKNGNTANGEVDNAFDYKLGDITQSFAERQANGLPVDTTSYASTEASPTGQYSIADVGLPSPLNEVVNSLGDTACPALTNLWVAAALGGVNIAVAAVVGALTGGEGDVGIVGGEAAAETAADQAVPSLATKVLAKIANGGSKLKDFGVQTGRSVALIGGATLIARAIVTSEVGASHNSLAVGQPYDDTLYCGTNIYANDIEQRQFYGAPMSDSYLSEDNSQNRAQLAYKAGRQSTFSRYLSVNNSDSLLSRTAMASSGYFNSSVLRAPLHLGSALLSPVRSFSSVVSPLLSRTSFAAAPTTSVNTYCGNVQFGFTPYEKQLISTDPTYKPLENQLYLDQSGQEDAISARYGKCFDGSLTIGQMLTTKAPDGEYYIVRDSDGSVAPNKGLCSPKNLGTANNDPGQGPGGHGFHDLVFRWRVAQGYKNTLDQLGQMQEVSTDAAATPAPSPGSSPSGTAQQLAQQILQQANAGHITFNILKSADSSDGSTPKDNIQETANGQPAKTTSNCSGRGAQPPNATATLNTDLLKFILELSQAQDIQINALAGQCHGETSSNHYKGLAVDFGCPFSTASADRIGQKYNISDGTGETCGNTSHYHYSIGGH
jgi:hypothetical protein